MHRRQGRITLRKRGILRCRSEAEKRVEAAVAGIEAQRPEIERRYDAQARQNDQGYMLFYRKKREGEARMWRGKEEEKKRKRREKTGKTRWGGK